MCRILASPLVTPYYSYAYSLSNYDVIINFENSCGTCEGRPYNNREAVVMWVSPVVGSDSKRSTLVYISLS